MVLVHVLWLSCSILQLLITSPVEHTGDARTIATSCSILTYGMPKTTTTVCSCSPGAPRSKTGRQVLSQVSRGRSSSTERRNSYSPTELENVGDTREFTSSGTQHSSTQTDLREQEIQTDPWFYRSEGNK
jgi:hypothetical protein